MENIHCGVGDDSVSRSHLGFPCFGDKEISVRGVVGADKGLCFIAGDRL